MNQVVAYNIAFWRKHRGLTQEQLGKRMEEITGKKWSKATMSAVERSWDSPRIRSFDADDLIAFSQALGFPVNALLMPPEDDGTVTKYYFEHVGGTKYRSFGQPGGGGEELMEQLFISEYSGRAEDEGYLIRLQEAFDFYYGGIPEEAFFQSRQEYIDDDVMLTDQADRLRRQIATLREVIGTLDRAVHKIDSGEITPAEKRG